MTSPAPLASTQPAVYLVAIDATESATHVIELACRLGQALGGAAELHLVHVVAAVVSEAGKITPVIAASLQDRVAAGQQVLARGVAYAAERFEGKIVGHCVSDDPWRGIVQMASSLSADLVVVGTSGRTGVSRLLLGSVAEQVVRHAACPVLVARPKEHHAHDGVEIEPPCSDCVAVREKTGGSTLWCPRHSEHHAHGRLHYEVPPTFALGSMNFRPPAGR